MATSQTVSTTVFSTRKIIEHAFRRCKLNPQQITSEPLETSQDLLYLILSSLSNKGIKLWNVQTALLGLKTRENTVATPIGTVDVLNCNLRTQHTLSGAASASEGTAANAFDGSVLTSCTQTLAGGNIALALDSAARVTTVGILPKSTGTWDFVVESGSDGITYGNTVLTKASEAVLAGAWSWFDIEGVSDYQYYRIRATGATVLDLIELAFQNTPTEIPLYQLNRDSYSNLPNKTVLGRPSQYWYDKQRLQPLLMLWPTVDDSLFRGQIVVYLHRHVQDVGSLTQEVEVPQRWYLAIVCELAKELGREIKEVQPSLLPILDRDAAVNTAKAWDGESDGSTTFLTPNIRAYTRC